MYLGNGPPRRRTGSNPIRVFILLVLIGAGLYLLTVEPEIVQQRFRATPTPTRTADTYAAEAESNYLKGDLEKAIQAYEEAIRRDPTILEYYIELTRLLVFESRYDEALDYADTALFVEPNNPSALAIKSMAMDWKSSALADEGLDRDADDMLREALGEANRAVEQDPASAEAHAYLAEILFDLGSYDQADEAIETALLLDEKNLDVQRIAGYITELRGYRETAVEHYQKAIELHPKLAMLYHALGRTYIGSGEIDNAVDSLETAIALDPNNSEYLYWLGYAYFTIGERDFAADYFQQAIELRPDYPAAHCQLGLIYYQQRNWEGAIPELETGVEGYGELITYRNAFCYYTLGLSYFYVGQCEDAYPLFDSVLEAVPENAPAEEGIRLCREAESLQPEEEPTAPPEN
ncbi:MAG: tetratricopeptide repeat protein [Anaerolineales bacterium]|nr:tetratricopeptide repeat protein [Anaerolineales bacterium]